MLKKYRRQFVTLNMCLVAAVLLVTLVFVGIYSYRDYYAKLESTMSAVLKPLKASVFDLFNYFYDSGKDPAPEEEAAGEDEEMRKNITTILYDARKGECAVISEDRKYDSDSVVGIVKASDRTGHSR